MKFPILISAEAEADISNAFGWYNDIRSTLADEFLINIGQIFEKISTSPYLFAVIQKNIRSVSVKKFPFVVFYKITGNSIEVFSVFHKKRNPTILEKRKK